MQPENHSSSRRGLIVVGKMGHGKSSFVRSLVIPKSANPFSTTITIPTISSGLKSATLHPQLYLADPSHNLTADNEPLYVIDTEGLDSDTSVSLVLEEIDEIIKQYRLSIIGVAFVINHSGRLIGTDGDSVVRKFLTAIKIRRSCLEDILFFVASNWRSCIENGEVEEKIEGIREVISHARLNPNIFSKTVLWESGPGTIRGYQKFAQQYLSGEGKQQIEKQWSALKSNLSSQLSKMCSFHKYVLDCHTFWERLGKQISICYKQRQRHAFQQQTFQLKFKMEQLGESQVKEVMKRDLKSGINSTATTFATYVQGEQNGNKIKMGQVAKNTQYLTRMANSFSSFLPENVKKLIEGASEVTGQMVKIINQETQNGLQAEENRKSFGFKDIPLAIASLGLLIYSTHQYYEEKKTKVLSPMSPGNLEEVQQNKLQQRLKLIQKSLIQASLYSKIFYKNFQLVLREDVDSIRSIKVYSTNQPERLIGQLTSAKCLNVNTKQQEFTVTLEILTWMLTFQSFDQIYRKQIAEFYST